MSTTSGPILVTGGGGFLGRSIIRALLDRGYALRSLARGDYPQLREWGVDLRRGDVTDANAVLHAAEGCAAVFHVAARVDVWGPYSEFFATNVVGTRT